MKQLKTMIMFVAGCLVSCTVRVCQLLFMTEPKTGFFYTQFQTLGTLLTILYITVFAATAVISFLELRGRARLPKKGLFTALLCGAVAVMLLINAVKTVAAADGLDTIGFFSFIFTLGAAAFFVIEGLSTLKVADEARCWLSVFPALYWLTQVLTMFSKYMQMANISENLFDIGAMGLLAVFFLLYGKTVNGLELTQSMRLPAPVGLCAAMLCFISTLPRYIVMIFADGSILHETAQPQLILPVLAVLVVLLLPRRVTTEQ